MKPGSARRAPGTSGSTPAGIWSRTPASSRSLPRSRPLPGDCGAAPPLAGRWRASSWASSSSLPSIMRDSDGSGLAWRRCARSRKRRWLASTAAGTTSPCPGFPRSPLITPTPRDLDIVGRASLFQLLDTTATRMGRETLAAWLLAPADPMVATARQGAVAELAPLLDLRQEIELRGRAASGAETDPEPFLAWAEDPHGLGDRALAALGRLDRSDRGRRARHRGPERGDPGAALGRAAAGESARRRDGRAAGLRHHRRGRDRAARHRRLRRPARGAGHRRFHGPRVAAVSRNGWEPASAARRPCCAAWGG